MITNRACLVLLAIVCAFGCSQNTDKKVAETGLGHEANTSIQIPKISAIDTAVLNALADRYYKERQYLLAIDNYLNLTLIDSLNGKYYYRIGYCLGQSHQLPTAVHYYQKSADLGYREFESNKAIGVIYLLVLKDRVKAAVYFDKCRKLDPLNTEPDSIWRIHGGSLN